MQSDQAFKLVTAELDAKLVSLGYTREDVKKLESGDLLKQLRPAVRATYEVRLAGCRKGSFTELCLDNPGLAQAFYDY